MNEVVFPGFRKSSDGSNSERTYRRRRHPLRSGTSGFGVQEVSRTLDCINDFVRTDTRCHFLLDHLSSTGPDKRCNNLHDDTFTACRRLENEDMAAPHRARRRALRKPDDTNFFLHQVIRKFSDGVQCFVERAYAPYSNSNESGHVSTSANTASILFEQLAHLIDESFAHVVNHFNALCNAELRLQYTNYYYETNYGAKPTQTDRNSIDQPSAQPDEGTGVLNESPLSNRGGGTLPVPFEEGQPAERQPPGNSSTDAAVELTCRFAATVSGAYLVPLMLIKRLLVAIASLYWGVHHAGCLLQRLSDHYHVLVTKRLAAREALAHYCWHCLSCVVSIPVSVLWKQLTASSPQSTSKQKRLWRSLWLSGRELCLTGLAGLFSLAPLPIPLIPQFTKYAIYTALNRAVIPLGRCLNNYMFLLALPFGRQGSAYWRDNSFAVESGGKVFWPGKKNPSKNIYKPTT